MARLPNMRPSFSIQDSLHLLARYAKLPSNVFCRTRSDTSNSATAQRVTAWLEFWISADRTNHILCYFRLPIAFSQCRAFFSGAIPHIISLCSKKKMIWPNASRIVAPMAHVKPVWNRAKSNLPLKSGGYVISLFWNPDGHNTVSLLRLTGIPLPTAITLGVFGMKQRDASFGNHLDKSIMASGAAQ